MPRRICNWNRTHAEDKILAELDPAVYANDSHGLCPECKKIVLSEG